MYSDTTNAEALTITAPKPKITITNEHIQKIHKRFALATILIPFLGLIMTVGLLCYSSIGLVEIGLLTTMYALTIIGIEVGFHRHFSHHAFQTSTPIRVVLAILGSMAAEGPVIFWVSHHRRHHQHSDRLGDPHTPYYRQDQKLNLLDGLFHAHFKWLLDGELTNAGLYTKDLLRDPLISRINQLYLVWVILGLVLPAVLGAVLTLSAIGIFKGFLWGGLVRIFLAHHVTWSINSICHVYGQRPFETDDYSTNNLWLAIPSFGGSWHNNHHAFPNTAVNSLEWWQIDVCGWMIRGLEAISYLAPGNLNVNSLTQCQFFQALDMV
jgi:stearoyl-CoA desaturase (delta-9 desaturase)